MIHLFIPSGLCDIVWPTVQNQKTVILLSYYREKSNKLFEKLEVFEVLAWRSLLIRITQLSR